MPLETWFPLAIYFDDLPEAVAHRADLLAAVLDLESSGAERRAYPEMAWTGDLHGVEQIHHDPRFAWIVQQVAEHGRLYLQELGVDLQQVQLYIQRAWPVVARSGQEVGPHSHNNAHISAVYYIAVPSNLQMPDQANVRAEVGDLDPGSLVFFDEARVNEVSPGLGSENTDIILDWNPLNQLQVAYPPEEGRLMLFPAKQRHGVSQNETDQIRVSLSFDLVLTASNDNAGTYEFLAPPPTQWLQV
jgi:Putative 2OG-Fe(II) oxygenase